MAQSLANFILILLWAKNKWIPALKSIPGFASTLPSIILDTNLISIKNVERKKEKPLFKNLTGHYWKLLTISLRF